MHDALVTMKDGRTFCGPVWTWRPQEGYFTLGGDDDAPDRVMLRDVASAVVKDQRVGIGRIEDVDLLERARREGWDGT
jgi:hypothetical protein